MDTDETFPSCLPLFASASSRQRRRDCERRCQRGSVVIGGPAGGGPVEADDLGWRRLWCQCGITEYGYEVALLNVIFVRPGSVAMGFALG